MEGALELSLQASGFVRRNAASSNPRLSTRRVPLGLSVADVSQEWADNVINLRNERPSAVHAMLQYIYTFDYDYKYDSEYPFDVVGNGDKVLRESHFCLLDLFVRETACRHGLEGLQQVATNRFVEHVSSVSDPEVLSHVVKIVYGSGGGDEADLRGPVTRTIFNNARELFWIPCGTSFITAATGEPELCLDIIRGLVGKLQHCADSMMWKQGRWYYKCPFKCGFEFFSDKLALHRQFACPKCHGTQDGWMWNEYGTCVEVSPDDD